MDAPPPHNSRDPLHHEGGSQRGGGDTLDLWVYVLATGGLQRVGGPVGLGQARPPFLERLTQRCELSFLGLRAEIRELTAPEVESFVRDVLLDPTRTYPGAVLSPRENSSSSSDPYLLNPQKLAAEFLGVAHLWVIDEHATTFLPTNAVGDKRLSCYLGAMRVYMPGFSKSDRGHDHPLLVADRLSDEVQRAGLVGGLAWKLRQTVSLVYPVASLEAEARGKSAAGPESPTVAVGEAAAKPVPTAKAVPESHPPTAPSKPLEASSGVEVLEPILLGLASRLDDILETQEQLVDAITQLRTATAVRITHARALDRRLARLEELLSHSGREPVEQEEEPVSASAVGTTEDNIDLSLASLLRDAATVLEEDLLILDSAIRSAEKSPFEDLLEVSVVLKAMAEMARRRQSGKLGVPMREAFAEMGIDYRGGISESTPEKLRRKYHATLPDGSTVECYEHIALGNSYDPKHCLRIYFSSHVPKEPRFVIAHVGRHLDVISTT